MKANVVHDLANFNNIKEFSLYSSKINGSYLTVTKALLRTGTYLLILYALLMIMKLCWDITIVQKF
jgi:hypothetical protein